MGAFDSAPPPNNVLGATAGQSAEQHTFFRTRSYHKTRALVDACALHVLHCSINLRDLIDCVQPVF